MIYYESHKNGKGMSLLMIRKDKLGREMWFVTSPYDQKKRRISKSVATALIDKKEYI